MLIKIGIADDHQLFLKSLSLLITSFGSFEVTVEATSGLDFLKKLATHNGSCDLALIDVDMPVMDGAEITRTISQQYPLIKSVALSMKDDDKSIVKMLKAGCCAYLLKDMHPQELERALNEVHAKGYYNADTLNLRYRRIIVNEPYAPQISSREIEFLQLASSDLTYKQIAVAMKLTERTIDSYREALFEKFKVQSRVGMVLEAIRQKLVKI